MTDETTIEENTENNIPGESSNNTSNDELREVLKKRLELELGLPLTPQASKKIEPHFDDDCILVENFPIQSITTFKIGNKILSEDDYILDGSKGIIYLNNCSSGFLYLEYTFCLSENEYGPLLDLMVEYETDTGWNKNASSIKEKDVTVNYDTSLGKGALIQSMISDLRNKYSCYVEMV